MEYTKFSKKQELTMFWWNKEEYKGYNGIICDGSVRSGKTLSMAVGYIIWSMANYNNSVFGICGKTIDSLRRNVIMLLPQWLEGIAQITERRKENKIIVTMGNRQNVYYMFGGRDESSYALVQGITLSGVYFDEVALMPQSFVDQAMARCSVKGSKMWFNCNPGPPSHWFHQNIIKQHEAKKFLYLHFTMEDNLSLTEEVKDRYKMMWTGVFYQRYILGQWVAADGVIYKQFADRPFDFITDQCNEKLYTVVIGIDYGASRSHTTFKAIGFSVRFNSVYCLAERDLDGVFTPEEMYKKFEDFYLHVVNSWKECNHVYADYGSLGQVITGGLQDYMQGKGYPVVITDCTKGKILERIELVNQLMATGKFKILSGCPKLITALKEAVWDSKKEDTRLDDGSTDIDSLDAMEYALFPYANYLTKDMGKYRVVDYDET